MSRRRGRELATALSRHGAHRSLADAAALWRAADGDVATGISDAAGALAVGVSQTSRNDCGGTKFCVRAVRAENCGQRYRGAGPELVAGGAERSGTGESGNIGAICDAVCAVWIPARGAASGVRARGSGVGGDGAATQSRATGGSRGARELYDARSRGSRENE